MSLQKPHVAVWSKGHCPIRAAPVRTKEKNVQSSQEKHGDICK